MASTNAEQSVGAPAELRIDQRLDCAGLSYLERLGILYVADIRLTIVMELNTREMGVQQFYDTVGGSSYASVWAHFEKLVEHGWIRWVRDAPTGRKGRPEGLYRATEPVLIDTETWRTIPVSIRDGFTVMLLEDMGARLGEALEDGLAEARADRIGAFRTFEVDEQGWCKAHAAVERCFKTIQDLRIDAKIRLDKHPDDSFLMIVNLAAFEAPGAQPPPGLALPKAEEALPAKSWPLRIGKVFSDRTNLAIVDELNRAARTPAQLQETLELDGANAREGILRRCKRLTKLGWRSTSGPRPAGRYMGPTSTNSEQHPQMFPSGTLLEGFPPVSGRGKAGMPSTDSWRLRLVRLRPGRSTTVMIAIFR